MSDSPVRPVTPPRPVVFPTSPSSTALVYSAYPGNEIDDELIDQCAKLFSENYGVWGPRPKDIKVPKPGARVKMTGHRLREQCVAVPESTVLIVCYQRNPDQTPDLELVGHAFVTVWDYDRGRVGWVTQLVVSLEMRKRYIATSLLQMLKSRPIFHGITAIGLVSSHPAACHALSKLAGSPILNVDTLFSQRNAEAILRDSPLRGTLFEENCTTGAVSTVFTQFYVDHNEPLEALAAYRARGPWVLGELLDGHEFLIILPIPANASPRSNILQ